MALSNPFAAPVVDSLAVRVVVDSHYERFLPRAEHADVRIDHVGRIPGRQMTTFAAEWGLSLHLTSVQDGRQAQYLLDFGYTPEVLNRNLDLLAIDPGQINGLILSHGHRDHFGGLDGFVRHHRGAMRDDLALFAGGETAFREKWLKEKGCDPESWGAIDTASLAAQRVTPICCATPHALDGAFTSGHIARESFEEVTGGTLVADEDHYSSAERNGELVLDQHPDEHATCYVVKGRGLVVISACGHAGIVNTVRTAMRVANVDRVHAVIGGFHLGIAPAEYMQHTADALAAIAPDVIVPMHCTGAPFIELLRARMPERLVHSNLGSQFIFGA